MLLLLVVVVAAAVAAIVGRLAATRPTRQSTATHGSNWSRSESAAQMQEHKQNEEEEEEEQKGKQNFEATPKHQDDTTWQPSLDSPIPASQQILARLYDNVCEVEKRAAAQSAGGSSAAPAHLPLELTLDTAMQLLEALHSSLERTRQLQARKAQQVQGGGSRLLPLQCGAPEYQHMFTGAVNSGKAPERFF